ncbi:ATP-dependent DNA ligase [Bailinhaonella thermotolerans]|uniref:DNA ligase (ATP) n=1 Tax=Bailinhaonella thermotolerans TaxID=1070861 RepID=A0A3A4B6K1_9ACTN|nr:ATP-dependent DNA ligase [Bailinhaonella thermotolerans]RJL34197.1 ATP-dependent DNA ligase [Bailinhaonella thermotolerans]
MSEPDKSEPGEREPDGGAPEAGGPGGTAPGDDAPPPVPGLPVRPPVGPMLAKAVKQMPRGDLLYEPKWDGFRCVVFRDGDEVYLGSRKERPFTRYFPELVEAVRAELPERCVVDGEIVVRKGQALDWDQLQQRIHPARSRVNLLAEQTPATFIAFDLLALGDEDLMGEPFARRRERLEALFTAPAATPRTGGSVRLTPVTRSYDEATRWFERFEGAGLDGVVAKPLDAVYEPDKRVMFKVKHERTADVVVAGYREHKSGPVVGSLLLGLNDDQGRLQFVGVAASFPMKRRAELVGELAPYRLDDVDHHPWASWAAQDETTGRMPGAVSRWTGKKDLSWIPLRPELVIEVAYDHMEGTRFRHTAQFRRWRPDRTPESCTYEQLEVPVAYDLDKILS